MARLHVCFIHDVDRFSALSESDEQPCLLLSCGPGARLSLSPFRFLHFLKNITSGY